MTTSNRASVLVVDDEALLRRTMRLALMRAGYDVVEACDGVDALEKAAAQAFDAVFLDIVMPRKEGLQALVELRKTPRLQIIAMSGGGRLTSVNYLQAATTCGAHATLKKPFRMSEAISALGRLLPDTAQGIVNTAA